MNEIEITMKCDIHILVLTEEEMTTTIGGSGWITEGLAAFLGFVGGFAVGMGERIERDALPTVNAHPMIGYQGQR